ncbi:MAG: SDR family oxidoreductase [Candidatus Melainabacteria bacterium]|nr:MAG: SDR family oxidoreductase [Candidatus Melainabacteria bacterium]
MKPDLKSLENCFRLDQKVAIVTGGGGILGRQFCSGLAQFGAIVCICDINIEAAQKVSTEIEQQFGLKSHPYLLDVSNEESAESVIDDIERRFGSIDILHNNAATKSSSLEKFFAKVETYDPETWHEVMSVNVTGMFNMAKAVGKKMVNQEQGGCVVQTSSIYGILAPDQRIYSGSRYMGTEINTPAVYSVSKAAVVGLTNYLSTYWADKKIRVNTLTPGGVSSGQNDVFAQKYSQRVPLGRMAEAHEMVGALIFLASPAASYITGQNLVVDGGLGVW